MTQSKTEIFRGRTKAAFRYEVVSPKNLSSLAGKRYHFIGAGGVGMSALAKVLMENKAIVSGSDQARSKVTEELCGLGAEIKIGHSLANLSERLDAVVISAAIKDDNAELRLARTKGYRVYKYAELLGWLMNYYSGIAIAGTHGKSTTSGWLCFLLQQAGLDPSFIVGADIVQLGASSGIGRGRYFVAEACEYDRSFLNLRPDIAVVLNIEQDHLDYYKDEDQIVEAFEHFVLGLHTDGVIIANGQDPNAAKVIAKLPGGLRCQTFGLRGGYSFSAKKIRQNHGLYSFDVYRDGLRLGRTRISLPGRHNIYNALAVIAAAVNAGVAPQAALEILPDFTGVDRRLMLKAKIGSITVVDDYAHHPTEIRASLGAIRAHFRPGRIWCVFQPHQHSRTRFLINDFAESFKFADVTIVPDIYFVRDAEAAKAEVNSQMLVDRICANGPEAVFIDSFSRILDYLIDNVAAGDLVVTMGAGDIWKVADEYIQRLRENC